MDQSTARHLEAQADTRLLQEVWDYLIRLPIVPTTTALALKIRDRLDSPQRRATQARDTEVARRSALQHGANYTPAGLPVIAAALDGQALRLWTPSSDAHFMTDAWARMVRDRLQTTETIEMISGASAHFE